MTTKLDTSALFEPTVTPEGDTSVLFETGGPATPDASVLLEEPQQQPGTFRRAAQAGVTGGVKAIADLTSILTNPQSGLPFGQLPGVSKFVSEKAGEFAEDRGEELREITGTGVLGRVGNVVKPLALSGSVSDAVVSGAALAGEFGDIIIPSGAASKLRKVRAPKVVVDKVSDKFTKKYFAPKSAKKSSVPIRERLNNAAAGFMNHWVNALRPIEKIGKLSGQAKEFAQQAQWVRGARQIAKNPVLFGTRTLEGKYTGEALLDISVDIDRSAVKLKIPEKQLQQDFSNYLAAQRQLELAPRANVKTSKKASREAFDFIKHVQNKYGTGQQGRVNVLDDFADRYRTWTRKAFLEPAVEAGWLSKKEAKKILASNDFYAPFERVLDTTKTQGIDIMLFKRRPKVAIKDKVIKKGLGSKAGDKLDDIFEVSADRAFRIQVAAQKQKLINMLGDAADINPTVAQDIIKTKLSSRLPGVERVYRDGKVTKYVMPKDIIESLDGLNPTQTSKALAMATEITSLFRAGTTLSLSFSAKNAIRDPFQAFVYSKNGQLPLISPVKAMFEEFLIERPANFFRSGKYEPSEVWKEFMSSPGPFSSFVSLDAASITGELAILRRVASLNPVKRAALETGKDLTHGLKLVSSTLEKPSRFAEFKLARKAGKSIGESALDSSDVTLNFLRAGSTGAKWNRVEAFSNVLFQDVDKFMRAMKERGLPTALKGITSMTIPTLGLWAKNRNNPDYQALPDWEKFAFLHVAQLGEEGKGGKFVRIPLPPGVLTAMFSYLPLKAAEFFFEGNDAAAEEFIARTLNETPFKYIPGGSELVKLVPGGEEIGSRTGDERDFLINLAPTPVQPLVELYMNRSPFFDQPAISERLRALPPDQRLTELTSNPARLIGDIPGVDRMLSGPAGVDFLIRAYAGSLGSATARALSPDINTDTRFRGNPEFSRGVPLLEGVVDAFTSTSPLGFGSQPVREFYDIRAEAQEAFNGVNQYTNSKDRREKHKQLPLAKYSPKLNEISSALSELARDKIALTKNTTLTQPEIESKLLEIDTKISVIAGGTVERIRDLVYLDLKEDL